MMNPTTIGDVIARRLQEARRARGMTRAQLAAAATALSEEPISEQVIKAIETNRRGERADLSVSELLVLSAAVGVWPVHLVTPRDDNATVAVSATLSATAAGLRTFLRGGGVPEGWPLTLEDKHSYTTQTPLSELLEGVEHLRRRGWDEDTLEDIETGIRTGEPPFPADVTERKRAELNKEGNDG